MAFDLIKNFAVSTVAIAPSTPTAGTTLSVQPGDGSLFPTPTTSPQVQTFNVVVWPAGSLPSGSNAEILKVTGKSTDQLTIVRQQESSASRSIQVGDNIALMPTGKVYTDLQAAIPQAPNVLRNGNFINNASNGYGNVPDDWVNSSLAGVISGGYPSLVQADLTNLGINAANIQGFWNLNAGSFADLSPNNYALTPTGSPGNDVDGIMGVGTNFAYATSYASIADASCPNLKITGSLTFIAYIKPTNLTTVYNYILSKRASSNGYFLALGSSNQVILNLDGLTGTSSLVSDVILQNNKWYMIVGVYDATNNLTKLWVNGVKKQATSSGTIGSTASPFDLALNANNTAEGFAGTMQNIIVLNTAMTDAQVKQLWAKTSYKGVKLRRNTTDGYLVETLTDDLIERFRGKTLTVRADLNQDTASIGQLSIYDGTTETASPTFTATGTDTLVSATQTISATATTIQVRVKVSTTTGNVYAKKIALYEASQPLPYDHSRDDWSRFPRMLRMSPPSVISAYQFEERRMYAYSPLYTGFSANPTGSIDRFMVDGKTGLVFRNRGTMGTSNASGFTISLPFVTSSNLTNSDSIIVDDPISSGGRQTTPGRAYYSANAAVLNLEVSLNGAVFSNTGGKDAQYKGMIEID